MRVRTHAWATSALNQVFESASQVRKPKVIPAIYQFFWYSSDARKKKLMSGHATES